MDFFRALTVEAALAELRRHFQALLETEKVDLRQALGRVLARDCFAPEDVPGFDRSTMDGFAVRARDTFGASEGLPAYLEVTGEILMGEAPSGEIGAAEAFRVPTGGMLPAGADAVVMLEYTEPLDDRTIGVVRPVAPGENVIRRGDDLRRDEQLFEAGHRLRPQDVGLLAAAGIGEVEVYRRLRVGIITTGDEIVPVKAKPGPGQVRDVNSYTAQGQVVECGGEPVLFGVVPDEFESLAAVLRRALAETDLVVISGGSSVGARDITARVIDSLGEPGVLFHGLAVRPGKPTIGAVVGGKLVFGLPGHPVSAMVVFRLLVAPLLDPRAGRSAIRARIRRSLRSQVGKEDYVRVRLVWENGELYAEPVLGKSGLIATMARADGLARIPLDREGVAEGEPVEVILF
ncbi:gephyrin-like molybdotransferase Glp [Desulforudis sp. 1088]|uniref:molybdopterin molybdotransferase MoeA n=2 Tax=Candidatus Desulforudis TaxID=471826 RepID=UPI003CE547D4